jgi:hypothetical protein
MSLHVAVSEACYIVTLLYVTLCYIFFSHFTQQIHFPQADSRSSNDEINCILYNSKVNTFRKRVKEVVTNKWIRWELKVNTCIYCLLFVWLLYASLYFIILHKYFIVLCKYYCMFAFYCIVLSTFYCIVLFTFYCIVFIFIVLCVLFMFTFNWIVLYYFIVLLYRFCLY